VAWLAAAGRAHRLGRPPDIRTEVVPVLLGSLTPDLIDKPLLLAGVFVHGRSIGHSLTFLLACLVGLYLVRRLSETAAVPTGMWVLGIATHFLADFADDLVGGLLSGSLILSSWFIWPFGTPSTWDYRPGIALIPGYGGFTPLEAAVVAAAIVVAVRLRR